MAKPLSQQFAYADSGKETYDMAKPKEDTAYASTGKETYDMAKPKEDTAYAESGKETLEINKPLLQQTAYADETISISTYIYYVDEGYIENQFDYVLKFETLI
jgi:hypothetical protein